MTGVQTCALPIFNLLKSLQQKWGLAYLFITHNISVIEFLAHEVAVMYLGRIVETGTRDEVFDRPLHPYTRALLGAASDAVGGSSPVGLEPTGSRPTGCAFRDRCPIARAACAEEVPALVERGQGHAVACLFPDGG